MSCTEWGETVQDIALLTQCYFRYYNSGAKRIVSVIFSSVLFVERAYYSQLFTCKHHRVQKDISSNPSWSLVLEMCLVISGHTLLGQPLEPWNTRQGSSSTDWPDSSCASFESIHSLEAMRVLHDFFHYKNSMKSHYMAHANSFGWTPRLVGPSSKDFELGHCLSVLGDLHN